MLLKVAELSEWGGRSALPLYMSSNRSTLEVWTAHYVLFLQFRFPHILQRPKKLKTPSESVSPNNFITSFYPYVQPFAP